MGKNKKRVTPNSVEYYFLVNNENNIHKLGKLKIKRGEGDIYFFPSIDFFIPTLDEDEKQIKELKYLSFHKSGEFHFKVKKGIGEHRLSGLTDIITEEGKGNSSDGNLRSEICDIKFQNMLEFHVKDISKLRANR